MKYTLSYILFFNLLLVSCDMETVIDLDIPPHESVLVLNGIFNARICALAKISARMRGF